MSQTERLSSTKNRLYSFDFMRALCAFGIVVFHYSCQMDSKIFRPLYCFINGLCFIPNFW